jgi:hypothetical protein
MTEVTELIKAISEIAGRMGLKFVPDEAKIQNYLIAACGVHCAGGRDALYKDWHEE